MSNIFTTIFYQPILNLLVFLYNSISFQDLGVAIVLLTVTIKAAFWPLSKSSIKSQKALQDLQPKLEELKVRFGADRVGLGQATMDLYRENNVNPFSSCLPLLIQLPFLFAVYRVFSNGLKNHLDLVYSFIAKPEAINTVFLGFLDLAKPSIYLAVLAGLAQFWQAKMIISKKPAAKPEKGKEESLSEIMNKQMLYFMPAITIFIGLSLPGGLTLYWFVFTLLTILQQTITFRQSNNQQSDGKTLEGELVK